MTVSTRKCPYCGAGWAGRIISPAHVTRCRRKNMNIPSGSPDSLPETTVGGSNLTQDNKIGIMYGIFAPKVPLGYESATKGSLDAQNAVWIESAKREGESFAQELENEAQVLTIAKTNTGTEPKWVFRSETVDGIVGPYKPIYSLSQEQRAYFVSFHAHKGQRDKSGLPYFLHPKGVAEILVTLPEYGELTPQQKKDAKTAAYLHDILEDTSITTQDLLDMKFRPEVVDVVRALTAPEGMPKEDYYNQVKKAGPIAVAVKLADLGHNNLPARRAQLSGSPNNPVQPGEPDHYTRLGKKYAKAYKALGADIPAHLVQFKDQ